MAGKTESLHRDTHIICRIGDTIVNRCAFTLKGQYKKLPEFSSMVCSGQMLQSNKFIKNFDIPNVEFHEQKVTRGDSVETYVGFLYINYGYKRAEEYVKSQFKKVYKELSKPNEWDTLFRTSGESSVLEDKVNNLRAKDVFVPFYGLGPQSTNEFGNR